MRHLLSKQWVVEVDVLVVLLAVAPEAVLSGPKAVSPASAKSSSISTESAVEVDILVVLLAVGPKAVLSWPKTVCPDSAKSSIPESSNPESSIPDPESSIPESFIPESAVEVEILVVLLTVPFNTVLGWAETVYKSELWSRGGEADHQEHQDD